MSAKIIPLRVQELRGVELSDEALMAGCAVGDQSALSLLYRRHHEVMRRFVARLLGARSPEIEDVVQQVFLTAWRQAERYRGESSVRTWLFGIAANTARRHQRGERRKLSALERLGQWISRTAPPHDEAVSHKQMVERLAKALDALPHDLRVAYVMCEIEEVPGVEAARVLSVRPGTIWRRLHEARRALREEIGGES